MSKETTNTKYFIEMEDGAECEFEANNVQMGWYPHMKEDVTECNLINPGMLSN